LQSERLERRMHHTAHRPAAKHQTHEQQAEQGHAELVGGFVVRRCKRSVVVTAVLPAPLSVPCPGSRGPHFLNSTLCRPSGRKSSVMTKCIMREWPTPRQLYSLLPTSPERERGVSPHPSLALGACRTRALWASSRNKHVPPASSRRCTWAPFCNGVATRSSTV